MQSLRPGANDPASAATARLISPRVEAMPNPGLASGAPLEKFSRGQVANMRCMPETPEQQLRSFVAKFAPAMGLQIRECRSAMRRRFPAANELVYDNYNFFVIGYCTTERPSDCVVSLAANSKGIGLSFYRGATLADPHRILQGNGTQNRFVRLDGVATLSSSGVQELLDAAEAQADPPFVKTGRGKLIIRSVSEKQRPRR
jgi:hypothetical protein